MPGEPTRRFVEALPADVTEAGRLPLSYAVLTSVPPGAAAPYVPSGVCDHHRTVGYYCAPFHKPISRCFGGDR
jgi:hypothetical protein